MRRILTPCLLALLLVPAAAAQEFNLGVTPPLIDAGVHGQGDRFYSDFHVFTASDRSVAVSLDARTGTLREFRQLRPAAANAFSAQPCDGCIAPLHGVRVIDRRDRTLSQRRDIMRWSRMPFLVRLPPDIEPGYHLMQVTPRPRTTGEGSTVSLVSTATIPVIFRVPGRVERSANIIGIRAAGDRRGRPAVEVTVHNTGTATIRVSTALALATPQGNVTVEAGERRIPPDATATFTRTAPVDTVAGRTVHATADFGTGTATAAATLTGTGEGQRQPLRHPWALPLILVLLAAGSIVLWVVRRG